MKLQGQEPLSTDDVCNEIFDMVRPLESHKITFEDLIAWYLIQLLLFMKLMVVCSGQADTIVNILIDITGFWAYENRELQLIETQPEEPELELV